MPTGSTKPRGTTATQSHLTTHRRGGHARRRTTPPPAAPPAPMRALDATPPTDEQRRQLRAMTLQQRVDAMNAGRLSLGQLAAWSAAHEHEVPLIGNELAYIARYDPEYCEADETGGRP